MITRGEIAGVVFHMSSFKTPKEHMHLGDLNCAKTNLKQSGELFLVLLLNLSKKKNNKDFFFKSEIVQHLLDFVKRSGNGRLRHSALIFNVFLNLSQFQELFGLLDFKECLDLIHSATTGPFPKNKNLVARFSLSLFLGFLEHQTNLGRDDIEHIIRVTYNFINFSKYRRRARKSYSRAKRAAEKDQIADKNLILLGLDVLVKVHRKWADVVHLGANKYVAQFFFEYISNFTIDCPVFCQLMQKIWALLLLLLDCDQCQNHLLGEFEMVSLTRPN